MNDGRRETRAAPSGPAALETARWLVSGRVQGVGFRWFVVETATALGLAGDVRNLPDGRVEVRARGEAAALERLLERLRGGPGPARVDRVERGTADPADAALPEREFRIRR